MLLFRAALSPACDESVNTHKSMADNFSLSFGHFHAPFQALVSQESRIIMLIGVFILA